MVAALLAMKAIRDLKLPDQKRPPHRRHRRGDRFPGHQVVLRQSPLCPHTPVPDADFPIINLEKGHYQPTLQVAWPQAAALPRVGASPAAPG